MDYSVLKQKWFENYQTSENQLQKMSEVKGLISAFNANIDAMGNILHRGWMYKKELASQISNEKIDYYYDLALKSGAAGGKLLGAGGSGFLLFYVPKEMQESVRKSLAELEELNFNFDDEGTKVIYYNN